jgi:hypothetical protein
MGGVARRWCVIHPLFCAERCWWGVSGGHVVDKRSGEVDRGLQGLIKVDDVVELGSDR